MFVTFGAQSGGGLGVPGGSWGGWYWPTHPLAEPRSMLVLHFGGRGLRKPLLPAGGLWSRSCGSCVWLCWVVPWCLLWAPGGGAESVKFLTF